MVSENPSPEKTDPTDVAKNWMAAVIWDIAVTAKQYPRLLVLLIVAIFVVSLLQLLYFATISSVYNLNSAGAFGDTFGFVTAFFTGVGFIGIVATILAQNRQLQSEVNEQKRQHAATSMNVVTMMEDRFDADRMRIKRHMACSFFVAAHDASSEGRQPQDPAENEKVAVTDVLDFLETVAHFSNRADVDEDLVLSVFHRRMRMYFHYAREFFPPLRDRRSERVLIWSELEKLSTGGIEAWITKEFEDFGGPEHSPDALYSPDWLHETLHTEHLRNGTEFYTGHDSHI
jgi:uncharacterized membrane protein